MMPIKEILAQKQIQPKPPVLVIDEATLKAVSNAGPACECCYRYKTIQDFKPFVPGGIHPYIKKTFIEERECLVPLWIRKTVDLSDPNSEKVIICHKKDLPGKLPANVNQSEELFFINPRRSVDEIPRLPFAQKLLLENADKMSFRLDILGKM